MSEEKRTTKVRKGVTRKIQTKQFESLEITTAYEDTIEWSTVEERQEKLNKTSRAALHDFKETFDIVCNDLGISEKAGSATLENRETGEKKSGSIENNQDKEPQKTSKDDLDEMFDGV